MLLVFLVEEPSAANVLHAVLPKMLPAGTRFQVIKHRGKTELRKSIPTKLKSWGLPDTRFVILHDQDTRDCIALKHELVQICMAAGRPDALVRIVCQELESWYFGDLDALSAVYGSKALSKVRGKAPYRNPDSIAKPSRELERLIPTFQKGSASESVPFHMNPERNSSNSFQQLASGIQRLCEADG